MILTHDKWLYLSSVWYMSFLSQECFTRVLKGHIALANVIFPNETKGKSFSFFSLHAAIFGIISFIACSHSLLNPQSIPVTVSTNESLVAANLKSYIVSNKCYDLLDPIFWLDCTCSCLCMESILFSPSRSFVGHSCQNISMEHWVGLLAWHWPWSGLLPQCPWR